MVSSRASMPILFLMLPDQVLVVEMSVTKKRRTDSLSQIGKLLDYNLQFGISHRMGISK